MDGRNYHVLLSPTDDPFDSDPPFAQESTTSNPVSPTYLPRRFREEIAAEKKQSSSTSSSSRRIETAKTVPSVVINSKKSSNSSFKKSFFSLFSCFSKSETLDNELLTEDNTRTPYKPL